MKPPLYKCTPYLILPSLPIMGNCLAIMGNCLPISLLTEPAASFPEALSISKKKRAVPIETPFVLPSPISSWPSGGGFAKGSIDLGGLEVCQVSTFTKIWASSDGGPDNLGATFFAPSPIPDGFFMLGSYAQPNNKPLFGWILTAKPTSDSTTLAEPVGYTLVWNSGSDGHFWLPVPPAGYKAVGHIVTSSSEKPALSDVRCVRADLTDNCEVDTLVWGNTDKDGGVNVYGLRPATRGVQALGVWTGTFMVTTTQNGDPTTITSSLACLKNKDSNLTSMPNLTQINALMQAYSPLIYFHPDENYLPSSVSWFFINGALLYKQADNTHPIAIDPTGSNLPQGGGSDGAYWLDLPKDDGEKDKVKRGDLATAETYLHVKPMLGATHTDIAIWVFYPFNGPAKAKVGLLNVPLGKIGEHVCDWEHVTLRVSNLTGELWRVYLSEHSGGTWVDASQLEFEGGGSSSNKAVVYASLNGHAFYAKPGLVLQGNTKIGIGIRNDAAKGKWEMDTGAKFAVAAADYLEAAVPPPAWLEYMREWGPKISYDVESELRVVERLLPSKLRNELEKVVKSLPAEVLGEEGPTGPKAKDNWNNDEKV